jgi:threonyl-tRNA synthetase
MKKVPLIVIVGEKEAQNDAMSLRLRGQNEVGMLKLTEISTILDKIK